MFLQKWLHISEKSQNMLLIADMFKNSAFVT